MLLVFWLFILIAVSDVLDGWLARRGNHITAFGRIADPFVDKVMVLGAMIYLAVCPWSQTWFPAWIVVVILAREFLVTGLRGYVEWAQPIDRPVASQSNDKARVFAGLGIDF